MSDMDFHSLKRKDLQSLCKKHKIPANGTNLEMADRLASLLKKPELVEEPKPLTRQSKKVRFCLEEEQNQLKKDEDVGVVETVQRKSSMKPGSERSNQNQISIPMTRSRRGAEVASLPSSPVGRKKPRKDESRLTTGSTTPEIVDLTSSPEIVEPVVEKRRTRRGGKVGEEEISTAVSSKEIVDLVSPPVVETRRTRRGAKIDNDVSAEMVNVTSAVEKKRTRRGGKLSNDEEKSMTVSSEDMVGLTSPVEKKTTRKRGAKAEIEGVVKETENDQIGGRFTRSLRNREVASNDDDGKLKKKDGGLGKTAKEVGKQVESVAIQNDNARQTRTRKRGHDNVDGKEQEESDKPQERVTRHSRRSVAVDKTAAAVESEIQIVHEESKNVPKQRKPTRQSRRNASIVEESVRSDGQSRTSVVGKNSSSEVEKAAVSNTVSFEEGDSEKGEELGKARRRSRRATRTVEELLQLDGQSMGGNQKLSESIPAVEGLPRTSHRTSKQKSAAVTNVATDQPTEEPVAVSNVELGNDKVGRKTKRQKQKVEGNVEAGTSVRKSDSIVTELPKRSTRGASRRESIGLDPEPVAIAGEQKPDERAGQTDELESLAERSSGEGEGREYVSEHSQQKIEKLIDSSHPSGLSYVVEVLEDEELETNAEQAVQASASRRESIVSNIDNLTEAAPASESGIVIQSVSGSYENNVEEAAQLCSELGSEDAIKSSTGKKQSILEEKPVETEEDSDGNLEKLNVNVSIGVDEKDATEEPLEESGMDHVREVADAMYRETPVLLRRSATSEGHSDWGISSIRNTSSAVSLDYNDQVVRTEEVEHHELSEEKPVHGTIPDFTGGETIAVDENKDYNDHVARTDDEEHHGLSEEKPVQGTNPDFTDNETVAVDENKDYNDHKARMVEEEHHELSEEKLVQGTNPDFTDNETVAVDESRDIVEKREYAEFVPHRQGELVDLNNEAVSVMHSHSDVVTYEQIQERIDEALEAISDCITANYNPGSVTDEGKGATRSSIDVQNDVDVQEEEESELLQQQAHGKLVDQNTENDAVSEKHFHLTSVSHEHINECIDKAMEAISDVICCANVSQVSSSSSSGNKQNVATPEENHASDKNLDLVVEDNEVKPSLATEGIIDLNVNFQDTQDHSNVEPSQSILRSRAWLGDAAVFEDDENPASPLPGSSPCNIETKDVMADLEENLQYENNLELVKEDNFGESSQVLKGIVEMKQADFQTMQEHINAKSDDFGDNVEYESSPELVDEDKVGESSQQVIKEIVEIDRADFLEMHEHLGAKSNEQVSEPGERLEVDAANSDWLGVPENDRNPGISSNLKTLNAEHEEVAADIEEKWDYQNNVVLFEDRGAKSSPQTPKGVAELKNGDVKDMHGHSGAKSDQKNLESGKFLGMNAESSPQIPKGVAELKNGDVKDMHGDSDAKSDQKNLESDVNPNDVEEVAIDEEKCDLDCGAEFFKEGEAEFSHEVDEGAEDGSDGGADFFNVTSNEDSMKSDKIVQLGAVNSDCEGGADVAMEENTRCPSFLPSDEINPAEDEHTPQRSASMKPVTIDGDRSLEGVSDSKGRSAHVVFNYEAREVVLRKPTFQDFFPIHFSSHTDIGEHKEDTADTYELVTMREVGTSSNLENVAEENVTQLRSSHDCVSDDKVVDLKEDIAIDEGTSFGIAQQVLQELGEQENHTPHKDEEVGGCDASAIVCPGSDSYEGKLGNAFGNNKHQADVESSKEVSLDAISSHFDDQLESTETFHGDGGTESNSVPFEFSGREIDLFLGDGEGNEAAAFTQNRIHGEILLEEKVMEAVSDDKFEDAARDDDSSLSSNDSVMHKKNDKYAATNEMNCVNEIEMDSVKENKDPENVEHVLEEHSYLEESLQEMHNHVKAVDNDHMFSVDEQFEEKQFITVASDCNTGKNTDLDILTAEASQQCVSEAGKSGGDGLLMENFGSSEQIIEDNFDVTDIGTHDDLLASGGKIENSTGPRSKMDHSDYEDTVKGNLEMTDKAVGLEYHADFTVDSDSEFVDEEPPILQQAQEVSQDVSNAQREFQENVEFVSEHTVSRFDHLEEDAECSISHRPLGDKENQMVLKPEQDNDMHVSVMGHSVHEYCEVEKEHKYSDVNTGGEDSKVSPENAAGSPLYSSDVPLENTVQVQGTVEPNYDADAYTLNEWEIDLFSGEKEGNEDAAFIPNRTNSVTLEGVETGEFVPDDRIDGITWDSSESSEDRCNNLDNKDDIDNARVSNLPLDQANSNGAELQEKLVSSPEGGGSIADLEVNMTAEEEEDFESSLSMLFDIEEAEGHQPTSESTPKHNAGKTEMDDINSRLRKFCISSALKGKQFRASALERTPPMKTPMRSSSQLLQSSLLASGMKENILSTKLEQSTNRTAGKSVIKRRALENLQNTRN